MCTKGSGTNSEMPPVRFCAQGGQTSQASSCAVGQRAASTTANPQHKLLCHLFANA